MKGELKIEIDRFFSLVRKFNDARDKGAISDSDAREIESFIDKIKSENKNAFNSYNQENNLGDRFMYGTNNRKEKEQDSELDTLEKLIKASLLTNRNASFKYDWEYRE